MGLVFRSLVSKWKKPQIDWLWILGRLVLIGQGSFPNWYWMGFAIYATMGVGVVRVFSRTSRFGLYKNSWVRKLGMLFWVPSMNSMSKSKTERIACYRAKICFDAMFRISFSKTCFANLQSILINKFWFKRSLWNFEMHSTIDKISFLIVL